MDDDERGVDPVTGCATRTFTCLGDQATLEVTPSLLLECSLLAKNVTKHCFTLEILLGLLSSEWSDK